MDYLPIFVDLRDRLVVVVGGGVVAARKIEHLLKAHARVRVVAPRLTPELALFRDAGRLEHRALEFVPAQLEGALLVVAATDDEAVNDAVSQAARERGVWVNVVDDAKRSAFIFPAIVDRSPLIVAIGTEGSSPTLARRSLAWGGEGGAAGAAGTPAILGPFLRWPGGGTAAHRPPAGGR